MKENKLIKDLKDREIIELLLTGNLFILQKLDRIEHYLLKLGKLQNLDMIKPLDDFPKSVQHLEDLYFKIADLHSNMDGKIERKRKGKT